MHKVEDKKEGFVAKVWGVIKRDPLLKPFVKEEEKKEEGEEPFSPESGV